MQYFGGVLSLSESKIQLLKIIVELLAELLLWFASVTVDPIIWYFLSYDLCTFSLFFTNNRSFPLDEILKWLQFP